MTLPPCDHDECGPSGCKRAVAAASSVRDLYKILTTSEERVIKLYVRGMSPKEIGAELFISPRTVNVHMHAIRRKMQRLGLQFAPLIVSQKQTSV